MSSNHNALSGLENANVRGRRQEREERARKVDRSRAGYAAGRAKRKV